MINFPKSITNGDIELIKQEPTFENARRVFGLVDKNRAHLDKWMPWVGRTLRAEDSFGWLYKVFNEADNGDYSIFFKGEVVGASGVVKYSEQHKSVEIGYWLSADATGQGIMTRVVKMLENLLFKELGFNKIKIEMDIENPASEAVAKRLNYTHEGTRRDVVFRNGEFRTHHLYSKLRREWDAEGRK